MKKKFVFNNNYFLPIILWSVIKLQKQEIRRKQKHWKKNIKQCLMIALDRKDDEVGKSVE
jgi:hypothetical protein